MSIKFQQVHFRHNISIFRVVKRPQPTSPRPTFPCSICNDGKSVFRLKYDLGRHVKKVHLRLPVEPWLKTCPECPFRSKMETDVMVHYQMDHTHNNKGTKAEVKMEVEDNLERVKVEISDSLPSDAVLFGAKKVESQKNPIVKEEPEEDIEAKMSAIHQEESPKNVPGPANVPQVQPSSLKVPGGPRVYPGPSTIRQQAGPASSKVRQVSEPIRASSKPAFHWNTSPSPKAGTGHVQPGPSRPVQPRFGPLNRPPLPKPPQPPQKKSFEDELWDLERRQFQAGCNTTGSTTGGTIKKKKGRPHPPPPPPKVLEVIEISDSDDDDKELIISTPQESDEDRKQKLNMLRNFRRPNKS